MKIYSISNCKIIYFLYVCNMSYGKVPDSSLKNMDRRFCAESLKEFIFAGLPFDPYPVQRELIFNLAEFCCGYGSRDVFMLNGYAGTGKTSIIGELVKQLQRFGKKTVVLAPTGRAAKVASGFSGGEASTIHRRIFRPESPEPGSRYVLAGNHSRDTVFIIDEASLITDNPGGASLLAQLVRYVYSGEHCAMIMLGDIAQLPPIGQLDAPAMKPDRLKELGLAPITFTLDVPARHNIGSGILTNATYIRRLLLNPMSQLKPQLFAKGFDDIMVISSADMAEELSNSWGSVGEDETVIITRSNKRANEFNRAIRNVVLMAEEPLINGERIVISKNDYYWSNINKMKNLIANGDQAVVDWVGKTEKMYGRYFTDVELTFPQSDQQRIGAKLMLRSLMCEGPSVSTAEMDKFYTVVLAEQDGDLTEKIATTLEDPYYNSLQAKYGYCITCHKAQGGQWKHVYIDMGGISPELMLEDTFLRWLYTAVTRATERVIFVNPGMKVV